MHRDIRIGAVAYAARAVPIWEGMRDYFRAAGPPIDYILFSNYDSQVQALLDGHIDIAWNTNLAWVQVQRRTNGACRALAVRDTDINVTTLFVARADSGVRTLADVRGKRLALGSADSAQAAILPIHFLQQAGIEPERDCSVLRFDLDLGKHGDTGSSELEVLRSLQEGQADVGALGEATWNRLAAEGRVDARLVRPIFTSPGYSHCIFTALASLPEDRAKHWTDSLVLMTCEQARWRELMDLEGLKRWVRADAAILDGYRPLLDAVDRQGLARHWNAK
jgi:ABC-type phosphate/phosphonate transport system substrate-binding protein